MDLAALAQVAVDRLRGPRSVREELLDGPISLVSGGWGAGVEELLDVGLDVLAPNGCRGRRQAARRCRRTDVTSPSSSPILGAVTAEVTMGL